METVQDGGTARTYIRVNEGDYLSLDGSTGEVILGEVHTQPSEVLQVLLYNTLDPSKAPVYKIYERLMKWADGVRTLGVRTNADQPDQCRNAIAFGAEGIGLCRTEHMFFGGDRIDAVREMILAETVDGRRAALAKILPYQRNDFLEIFRVMKGKPCTMRTLDPPLHEFLPHTEREIAELSQTLRHQRGDYHAPHRGTAGIQPDARISRLPARLVVPGDYGNAGAGDIRSRRAGKKRRDPRPAGNHDPARWQCERITTPGGCARKRCANCSPKRPG